MASVKEVNFYIMQACTARDKKKIVTRDHKLKEADAQTTTNLFAVLSLL
jgi:hypothetical protein